MITQGSYRIPPLENGDRLTQSEFEKRYEASPDIPKAELIEGVVYVASPVRLTHGKPHSLIITWLGVYSATTPGVDISDNTTVRLDLDNEPQPDALLRIETQFGGNSRISDDDYIEGAPEFIAEIAASSASYDLNAKLNVYRRNRVQEYLVWRVYENQIDWFQLNEGRYNPILPNSDGLICSQVFPGLWLAVEAMLTQDLATVLAELQKGIASAEHQAFIEHLNLDQNLK